MMPWNKVDLNFTKKNAFQVGGMVHGVPFTTTSKWLISIFTTTIDHIPTKPNKESFCPPSDTPTASSFKFVPICEVLHLKTRNQGGWNSKNSGGWKAILPRFLGTRSTQITKRVKVKTCENNLNRPSLTELHALPVWKMKMFFSKYAQCSRCRRSSKILARARSSIRRRPRSKP